MGKAIVLLLVVCMLIGASVSEASMTADVDSKSFAMQGSSSSGGGGGGSGSSSSGGSGSSGGGSSQTSSG